MADGHHPARQPDAAAASGSPTSGADNTEHTPYVIHRALIGSFERFIGILTEHYAGAFPFWLAPEQVRIIPVGREPPGRRRTRSPGGSRRYRVHVDDSDDTVGKRIRNAEVEKIPYVLVFGDKESDDSLAIREHGGAQETLSLQDFRAKLATLSPWQAGAEPSLTSERVSVRGFNRVEVDRETAPLHASGFVVFEEVNTSLVKDI